MISISGIRGVVGESLTPEVAVKYASAFAEYCQHGRIVIGRDGRAGGKILGNLVSSTLLASGCDVVALGIAPTPTIQIATEDLHASGGISLTASHNPLEWNGMKFIGPSGMFLNAVENKRLWSIADAPARSYARSDRLGSHTAEGSFLEKHIEKVLRLPFVKPDVIRARGFKVVADCINASGGVIVPRLLRSLGCEVIEMNCDVSGVFARTPEPIPENLGDLCRRVRETGAHMGLAVDPDSDRLVFITERGEPFGEEYTITSVIKFILEKHRPEGQTVVVNLSTTRAVEDVAKATGARVLRTPVGEINVAERMKQSGAVVGGEGSGGVILPAVHLGRDAIVGIGIVLQQLAEFGGTLSEFKATLPQYSIVKSKVSVSSADPQKLLLALRERHASEGRVNTDDGLKIDFADSWVHLRGSNTEPIVRIIAEARRKEEALELVRRFESELSSLAAAR